MYKMKILPLLCQSTKIESGSSLRAVPVQSKRSKNNTTDITSGMMHDYQKAQKSPMLCGHPLFIKNFQLKADRLLFHHETADTACN